MRKTNIYNQVLFLILFLLNYSYNLKIHILEQQPIENKKNLRKKINNDSEFSKVCSGILTTYSNLGENAFNIYKGCTDNYELLGSIDDVIIKDRPYCYDSINQFFCNYKIEDMEGESNYFKNSKNNEITTNSNTNVNNCGDDSLIELVLSIIKGCLNENSSQNYKCPSLDLLSFKISNPKEFCNESEKKELLSPEEGEDYRGLSYVYSKIRNDQKQTCEYVTEMYNACIDADNLLYPFLDYKKCFNKHNNMYFCNKLMKYSDRETDICSKFILPTFAYKTLHQNIFNMDKDFCSDYESQVTHSYDEYIKKLESKINEKNEIISGIEKIISNNNNLSQLSHNLLNSTQIMTQKWLQFYPEMSQVFNLRKNLTEVEFSQLAKMRNSFDEFFPYAANLNQLTQDEKFVLSNFTNLNQGIIAYYTKSEILIDELSNEIDKFNDVLMMNRNLTILKDMSESKEQFMITQTINQEEVLSFQNEFVEITQYMKRFMNFVMKRIKETHIEYTDKEKLIKSNIRDLEDYIERIKKQKEEVYKVILG